VPTARCHTASSGLCRGNPQGRRSVTLSARATVAWLLLFVAMFGNGAIRVLVLQPRLGADLARQVASLSGVVLVLFVSWLFVRASPSATPTQLRWVGAAWVCATVAFEFLFGRFVSGLGWPALLADYDVSRGRLWPVVLLSVFLGPWLFRIERRNRSRSSVGAQMDR
jgi:hypothetical protein